MDEFWFNDTVDRILESNGMSPLGEYLVTGVRKLISTCLAFVAKAVMTWITFCLKWLTLIVFHVTLPFSGIRCRPTYIYNDDKSSRTQSNSDCTTPDYSRCWIVSFFLAAEFLFVFSIFLSLDPLFQQWRFKTTKPVKARNGPVAAISIVAVMAINTVLYVYVNTFL